MATKKAPKKPAREAPRPRRPPRPHRPRRPRRRATQAEEAQRAGCRRAGPGRIEGADERQADDRGDGGEGPVDQPRRQDAAATLVFRNDSARSPPRVKRPGSRRPIAASSRHGVERHLGTSPNAPRRPRRGLFSLVASVAKRGPPAATRAKRRVHVAASCTRSAFCPVNFSQRSTITSQ